MAGQPAVLAEGEQPAQSFQVFAGASCTRRFALDGYERISWRCRVLEDYDIIFSSRLACASLQCGAPRGLEVTERERAGEFEGYLDLGKDHKHWLVELGAAPSSTAGAGQRGGGAGGGGPVLELEFDNSYSFFTAKTVELQLWKLAGAPPRVRSYGAAIAACEASRQWERALQLLARMRDVGLAPDVAVYNAALGVCRASRKWQGALELLDDMRRAGVQPDRASYNAAISACENEGLVDRALRLMDEMPTEAEEAEAAEARPNGAAGEEERQDLEWLRQTLAEALERCPVAARELRGHLAAAQGSLEAYSRLH
mmetsp:Transcript_17194/g.54263  ORF Transcript_17194/g.54263 Transcript_17194/m.54263 type:complete len:313 (+) Transcript_17194:43-981(+)